MQQTEGEIDAARGAYRPVAVHASVLFFCVSDLAAIEAMYQFSLTWFITLYLQVLLMHCEIYLYRNFSVMNFHNRSDAIIFSHRDCLIEVSFISSQIIEAWALSCTVTAHCQYICISGNPFDLIILFFQTIRNSSPSEDVDIRIGQLNTHLTWAVFLSVCRSLFERDKLLFSFMLCVRLQQAQVVYFSFLKSFALFYNMVSFY